MQSKTTEIPRPEIGMIYANRQGKQVQVFSVCQTHVVYRHQPFNELAVDKRGSFAKCYMSEEKND